MPNTIIAYTLQSFVVGDFDKRYVNRSSRIKLPKSNNNLQIFENIDQLSSSTRVPYQSNTVRYRVNGNEIINNGVLIVNEVNEFIDITIYGGLLGFTDVLGDKMLWELPDDEVEAGVVTPTINDSVDETYNNEELPCVLYSALIESILDNSGFTYSGDVFSNTDYNRMILYYSRPKYEYTGSFATNKQFKATISSNQVYTPLAPAGAYQIISFPNEIFNGPGDGDGQFYDGLDRWNIRSRSSFNFNIYCDLVVSVTGGSGTVRIAHLKSGSEASTPGPFVSATVDVAIGASNQKVTITAFSQYDDSIVAPLEYWEVGCKKQSGINNSTLTIHSATWYVIPILVPQISKIGYNYIMPEIRQIDFIKDFLIRFGLVMVQGQGNSITFKHIEDILNDRANAVDWTSKRVNTGSERMGFSTGNYSQNNEFKYSQTDDVSIDGENDHIAVIDNLNLKLNQTIYQSFFSNTLTTLIEFSAGEGINMAHVPIYDLSLSPSDDEYFTDPGFRLLMQRDRYTDEAGTGKVAYFNEPRESINMDWKYFVETYYGTLFDNLSDFRSVEHYYNLTESDVVNFDPTLLIYDNGFYYAFPSVDSYVPNRTVRVKMLKI